MNKLMPAIWMGLCLGWLSQATMPTSDPIEQEEIKPYWHVYTTFEEMEWCERHPEWEEEI